MAKTPNLHSHKIAQQQSPVWNSVWILTSIWIPELDSQLDCNSRDSDAHILSAPYGGMSATNDYELFWNKIYDTLSVRWVYVERTHKTTVCAWLKRLGHPERIHATICRLVKASERETNRAE